MKHLNRLLLVLASASFFYASAQAQNSGTVTNNAFAIGKGPGVQGFGSVPCTSGQIPIGQSGAPQCKTPSGQVTINSSGTTAITPGAANTVKGSLNGTTTSDIAIASCSLAYQFTQWVSGTGWQCGIIPVLPSRAIAAALNLSAFSAVQTLGYATPGDGGGSTFKNVGSSPFIDSFVSTYTITGGAGYTNGGYFGVVLVNTTKPYLIGTATVAGGVVTAVDIQYTPGNQCAVGDQYTSGSIPAGTGFKITVTACSTPLGSFSDSASTRFQLVTEKSFVNILQFGAVADWNGSDAGATDNFNAVQATAWFAANMNQSNAGGGGYWGSRVMVPQGTFKLCGTTTRSLVVPNGTFIEGVSTQGSVLKMCDTFSATTHFVELCDPNWHFACFDSGLRNIQLNALRAAAASSNFAMVHSNATQDFGGLDHVYIYGGLRTCAFFEKGYGGASQVQFQYVSCSTASAAPQIQIGNTAASGLNYGSTNIFMHDIVLGGPSSGGTYQSGNGILIYGGLIKMTAVHCENMPVCVEINNTTAFTNGNVEASFVNAGSGAPAPTCTGVIQLDSTNTVNNALISMIPAGSCTNTITNGVSGGVNSTGNITKAVLCPAGSCS